MVTRKGLLYAAVTCAASILVGFSLVAMVMTAGCATLSPPPGTTPCQAITYYGAFLYGAEASVTLLQGIFPGIPPTTVQKVMADLKIAEMMFDQASKACDSYASGQTTVDKVESVLMSLYDAIRAFNQSYGQLSLPAGT